MDRFSFFDIYRTFVKKVKPNGACCNKYNGQGEYKYFFSIAFHKIKVIVGKLLYEWSLPNREKEYLNGNLTFVIKFPDHRDAVADAFAESNFIGIFQLSTKGNSPGNTGNFYGELM